MNIPQSSTAGKADAAGPYAHHQFCKPVPITDLTGSGPAIDWVWEGILARRRITLLSAQAKAGKTTLATLLLREMGAERGSLLGCPVHRGKCLLITEESDDAWILRRDQFGLGPYVLAQCLPFIAKPNFAQWRTMLSEARAVIQAEGVDLVVFDTLSHLWPVQEENNNGQMQEAIMPTRELAEAGAAVLLMHHAGAAGNRSRGATELEGFVDQIAHMQLAEPLKPESRARSLAVKGRLTNSPTRLRIELNHDGDMYQLVEGDLRPVRSELWATMERLVPREAPGWPLSEFSRHWPPEQTPPSADVLRVSVNRYADRHGWHRSPEHPPRYWKPRP